MLLTLDIGNTNIKSALFEDDKLTEFIVHPDTHGLFDYFGKYKFTEAAICSVNPTLQKILQDKLSEKAISIFLVGIKNKFNLTIKYDTPTTLGMDRVCSAVGALEIATNNKLISENQYLITIDFGTATTINIVSPYKQFIGGLIAPGITTMLKSLNEKTAQLPLPDPKLYNGLIGDSTSASIVSGVINATVGMVNETINKLKVESKVEPIVFVTGGNLKFILPFLKHKVFFDEALVLKGLKLIFTLNS